jgi:aryl-alcohol dehydrogenase-like predicted oxidoreductase
MAGMWVHSLVLSTEHRPDRAGYTTFDVAPFYGNVEDWLGRIRYNIENPFELGLYKIFTKLVLPPVIEDVSLKVIEAKVDESLGRLRAQRLDLVQLHW